MNPEERALEAGLLRFCDKLRKRDGYYHDCSLINSQIADEIAAILSTAPTVGWLDKVTVCDCHTWPTVKEMHDYCVALEDKLNERHATAPPQRRQ